jgi:acyl-CoA synthetase (AMP-forming)/AMP-acid ligase II
MTVEPLAGLRSFAEVLAARARERPGDIAFTFIGDQGDSRITYGELDRRAGAIGTAIREAGGGGERAVIVHPPGLEYVAALFGCFRAGAVAVPAYPPDPTRPERALTRLRAIAGDARPRLLLTIEAFREPLAAAVGGKADGPRCLTTDSLPDGAHREPAPEDARDGAPALLQYTSGTTAAPRGVVISHANLLGNSDFIRRAFETSPRSRGVIWLPPYHDMGLVGGILQPVFTGFPCALMSPLTFLRRPLSWLRAVSDHRATVSGGPNFAYDLCVRRIGAEDAAALDLSAWEIAFNGAEEVRRATLDAFSARFAHAGFRREALYPCYGLAESTLMVTGGRRLRRQVFRERAEPGRQRATVVGCGSPDRDHVVLIVDPQSREPVPEGEVGEIWTAGPSVADGYWRRPAETERCFAAHLATGRGPFLRTGDLGVLVDNELFVTGRIKDVLVVRGRNHNPADVELACEATSPELRKGCGAAFGFERERGERVAVVYEVADRPGTDHDAVIAGIRRATAQAIDAQVDAVVLIAPRTIPRTSSGKVQRHRCRKLFLERRLEAVAEWSLAREEPGAASAPGS